MIAFIIQARQGSKRLPNKMNLSFFQKETILEIIIRNIKSAFPGIPIILATTKKINDNSIALQGTKNGVKVFRGDEENVLKRFIEAAQENKISKIIRICADNPFLDMDSLKEIITVLEEDHIDYVSFQTRNNIPTIKTHYGFWAEGVSTEALKKVQQKTTEVIFQEHVTNYIYSNPQQFKLYFLKIPASIEDNTIRLTIDTLQDFQIGKEIYQEKVKMNLSSIEELVKSIQNSPHWLESMRQQIEINNK